MFCKECGKETDNGELCPECEKKSAAVQEAAPADVPVPEPAVVPAPENIGTADAEKAPDFNALKKQYRQMSRKLPRTFYFWIAKLLVLASIACFFTPFLKGTVDMFGLYEQDSYTGFELLAEAKEYIQSSGSDFSRETALGAWGILLITAVGLFFMFMALIIRRAYGAFSLGTVVVYGILFLTARMVSEDSNIGLEFRLSPQAGLLAILILMTAVFIISFIDLYFAREKLHLYGDVQASEKKAETK